jgi:hypothetical protein
MKPPVVWLTASLLSAAGCAGMAPHQIGQTVGAIAGSAVVPGIGAPIGSLLGIFTGLLVQKQMDDATEKRERVELGDRLNAGSRSRDAASSPPPSGTPTRVWVDESEAHGRLIAGHFDVRPVP